MFKYIMYQMMKLGVYLFWKSRWGVAISLSTWNEYKNSPLFEERTKHFGSIEAAKLFSFKEYSFFKEKVYKDKEKLNRIIWRPTSVLEKLLNRDTYIRQYVNFGED